MFWKNFWIRGPEMKKYFHFRKLNSLFQKYILKKIGAKMPHYSIIHLIETYFGIIGSNRHQIPKEVFDPMSANTWKNSISWLENSISCSQNISIVFQDFFLEEKSRIENLDLMLGIEISEKIPMPVLKTVFWNLGSNEHTVAKDFFWSEEWTCEIIPFPVEYFISCLWNIFWNHWIK